VWGIIQCDLPALIAELQKIIKWMDNKSIESLFQYDIIQYLAGNVVIG